MEVGGASGLVPMAGSVPVIRHIPRVVAEAEEDFDGAGGFVMIDGVDVFVWDPSIIVTVLDEGAVLQPGLFGEARVSAHSARACAASGVSCWEVPPL